MATPKKSYRMSDDALKHLDALVEAKVGSGHTEVLHVVLKSAAESLGGQPVAAAGGTADSDEVRALRARVAELEARPRTKKADGQEVAALRAELEELRLTNESLRDTNKKLMDALPAEALKPDRPESVAVKEPGIDQTAARADVQPVAVAQPITEYMDPVTKGMVKYEPGPSEF